MMRKTGTSGQGLSSTLLKLISLALKSLYILISYDSLLKQKHLYVFPFRIDAALMNRDYCLSPSKAQILNTRWCMGLFFFSLSFIPAAA